MEVGSGGLRYAHQCEHVQGIVPGSPNVSSLVLVDSSQTKSQARRQVQLGDHLAELPRVDLGRLEVFPTAPPNGPVSTDTHGRMHHVV